MRDRKETRGYCRSRAAGRTARGVCEIPRIAAWAVQAWFCRQRQAEFRCVGLAVDNQPGGEIALDESGILSRKRILKKFRPTTLGCSAERREVLEQERHARNGPSGKPRAICSRARS